MCKEGDMINMGLFLYSLLTMLFQDGILFLFLYLPLCLWFDKPYIFPSVITVIILLMQVFFASSLMERFFISVSFNEEAKEKIAKFKQKAENILDKLEIKNVNVCVFYDPIPILSSVPFIGKPSNLYISTGFFEYLGEEEIEIMLERESFLVNRNPIFISVTLVPFIFYVFSMYLWVMVGFAKYKKGTAAYRLAHFIVYAVFKMSEIFILPLFRILHNNADKYVIAKKGKNLLSSAINKVACEFIKPVEYGPPFRKRVFEGMKYMLPFDPHISTQTMVWASFLKDDAPLHPLAAFLEKNNPYFKILTLTSSHPSPVRRFKWQEEEFSILSFLFRGIHLKFWTEFLMYPLTFVSFVLFKSFALSLLVLALGKFILYIIKYHKGKKDKVNLFSLNSTLDGSLVKVDGQLHANTINQKVEAPYIFLSKNDKEIVLKLFSPIDGDEPLYPFDGEDASVYGVFRIYAIPFVEIKNVLLENGKKVKGIKEIIDAFVVFLLLLFGICLLCIGPA